MQVTMKDLPELVLDVLRAQLVPFIVGSPGIGKSDLAKQIATEHNLHLIDVRLSQMDPSDLLGLPFKDGNKASYLPMNIFPLEGDPIPNNKNGFLIFMDEMNAAPISVQAAAYRIVLDRQVGMHNLHPKAAIIAAGNKTTDKAIVNRLSTAMQSRLIHFELAIDEKTWIKWADNNSIDHRIKSFINFKPDALHKFNPNHNEETFPAPRTWAFLSKLIKPYDSLPVNKIALLAGCIGEGMAREFYSFTKIYGELPTIGDILRDPKGITINPEPSIQYALTGLIAHNMTINNSEKLIAFMRRMSIDFQIICLRSCIARDPQIKTAPAFKSWIVDHSRELV